MTYKMMINGEAVSGASGTFDVINPADKSGIAACPKASVE